MHYPHDETTEAQDQDAVGAEIAAAKFANVWPAAFASVGSDNNGEDVGGAQIRSTRHETGRLLIHPEDRDEQIFVLVIGALPTYRLVGWMRASDAKRPEWWDEEKMWRCPCWAVPQDALHAFGEVPA